MWPHAQSSCGESCDDVRGATRHFSLRLLCSLSAQRAHIPFIAATRRLVIQHNVPTDRAGSTRVRRTACCTSFARVQQCVGKATRVLSVLTNLDNRCHHSASTLPRPIAHILCSSSQRAPHYQPLSAQASKASTVRTLLSPRTRCHVRGRGQVNV